MDEWISVFRSAQSVTVRGPDSARHLATLGWRGETQVIGDPALSLPPGPSSAERDEVLMAPLNTDGNLFGGSDAPVMSAFAAEAKRLIGLGMPVTLMASFPEDDRWILELERMIDAPVGYLCGYESLDSTLSRISKASLVVGERLHASILAAAMRTPFVAVAYRPKTLDFVRSVGAEHLSIRADHMGELEAVVDSVLEDPDAVGNAIAGAVEPLVELQHRHALAISAFLHDHTRK